MWIKRFVGVIAQVRMASPHSSKKMQTELGQARQQTELDLPPVEVKNSVCYVGDHLEYHIEDLEVSFCPPDGWLTELGKSLDDQKIETDETCLPSSPPDDWEINMDQGQQAQLHQQQCVHSFWGIPYPACQQHGHGFNYQHPHGPQQGTQLQDIDPLFPEWWCPFVLYEELAEDLLEKAIHHTDNAAKFDHIIPRSKKSQFYRKFGALTQPPVGTNGKSIRGECCSFFGVVRAMLLAAGVENTTKFNTAFEELRNSFSSAVATVLKSSAFTWADEPPMHLLDSIRESAPSSRIKSSSPAAFLHDLWGQAAIEPETPSGFQCSRLYLTQLFVMRKGSHSVVEKVEQFIESKENEDLLGGWKPRNRCRELFFPQTLTPTVYKQKHFLLQFDTLPAHFGGALIQRVTLRSGRPKEHGHNILARFDQWVWKQPPDELSKANLARKLDPDILQQWEASTTVGPWRVQIAEPDSSNDLWDEEAKQ